MNRLELKIPPPVIATIFAASMWLVAKTLPTIDLPSSIRYLTLITTSLFMIGIEIAGLIAFKQSKTTINPLKPETASSLVTNGIYQWTRNPMYLGLTILLIGWSIFLSSLYALTLTIGFVLYINRFQIHSEERILEEKFKEDFLAYKQQVRRWF